MAWVLYNLKLGSMYELSEQEAEEAKHFYKLFYASVGIWQNARNDIFLWETKRELKPICK